MMVQTYAKLNIGYGYLKPLKQIALDENVHMYQVLEKVLEEKYPSYFQNQEIQR